MPHPDGRSRDTAIHRPSARVVLLDADDRILLVRSEWDGRTLWFTPGGRLEDGETAAAAARRELHEETGVEPGMLRWEGVCWRRRWTWHWAEGDRWYDSDETFYLARFPVRGGDLSHPERPSGTEEEVLALREWRWWSLDELRTERPDTSPACLLDVLPAVIQEGCPPEPVHIGR